MESQTENWSALEPELLRQFLAGRDVPCPRCEYNLRDLSGDRCPECGDGLVLRVNINEPRLAALICGLVALSAGAGLNGLLLIYGIVRVATHPTGGLTEFFVCNGLGFALERPALCLWLKYWKRTRRLSPASRWKWAVACWLLTAANLTCFTLFIK